MNVVMNDKKYKIVRNYKNAFDKEAVEPKLTDYFDGYDYIVGDWAYNKLRLKGFCTNNNEKHNEINDAVNIDDYIENYCAYDCKYFILKEENK